MTAYELDDQVSIPSIDISLHHNLKKGSGVHPAFYLYLPDMRLFSLGT
jgi:hypothetical protein